ncbi:hypothetical protein HRM2_p00080 (plasmid) [Desulforapulum autotrophicum HRM2]|uniref:Uncharacterized protein n=2 Tax=Desulforapulum autotrophicum TaxID=2296 RepID=C0QMK8_DESAH|nr:hypothetical protein HRM2_p00080 [Desulforapulum autotrophicum HRM2]
MSDAYYHNEEFINQVTKLIGSGDNTPDIAVLSPDTLSTTISAGSNAVVYGTLEINHVIVESGATVKLINFIGNNEIDIESSSTLFKVSRSGATVTFEGTDGTLVKVPATSDAQSILFSDDTWKLKIESGKVLLGEQVIELSQAAMTGN